MKRRFSRSIEPSPVIGDFVLMCLPNNLWPSVKSNFARERLLASSYEWLRGVGFFKTPLNLPAMFELEISKGLISSYVLPRCSCEAEQLLNGTNTFDEIIKSFREKKIELPTNITGKPFIRKLGKLYADLEALMSEPDIKKIHCRFLEIFRCNRFH